MIRPIAFCAWVALAWGGTAAAADSDCTDATVECQTARIRAMTDQLITLGDKGSVSLLENRKWVFLDEGKATRLAIISGEQIIDTGILIDQNRWGTPLKEVSAMSVRSTMPVSVDQGVTFQVLIESDFVDNNTHQSETLFILSKTQLDHIIEQHGGKP